MNYTLDGVKKKLVCRLLRGKGFEKHEVAAQDTQFTLHGQSFQKFTVCKTLDKRFQETSGYRRASSIDMRMSIEASLQTVNEYFSWDGSHLVYLQELVGRHNLEDDYSQVTARIKQFDSHYVYMRGREEDYGKRCKELCDAVSAVWQSGSVDGGQGIRSGVEGSAAQTPGGKVEGRLYCSIVFSLLNKSISRNLEKSYEKEEGQLRKKMEAVKEADAFKPCEYGQDPDLASCPLTRSSEVLQALNKVVAPFEVVEVLQKAQRQIANELEEYSFSLAKNIPVTNAVATASLMTALLNAQIFQTIKLTIYMEYFSYVDYNEGEVSILIKKSRRLTRWRIFRRW